MNCKKEKREGGNAGCGDALLYFVLTTRVQFSAAFICDWTELISPYITNFSGRRDLRGVRTNGVSGRKSEVAIQRGGILYYSRSCGIDFHRFTKCACTVQH